MKKLSALAACALATLLLAGCSERTITGTLTAPGDASARAFTLQGDDGAVYSVTLAENAPVAAWPEGTKADDLYTGRWPALRLSVKGRLPLGGRMVTEEPLCAAFDKATGEALGPDDLFTCTGGELAAALLDAAAITDEPRRGEMLAAFDERRVVFRPDVLEVFYPAGAVPSEETALILGLDYTDSVKTLLRPRAVPEGEK